MAAALLFVTLGARAEDNAPAPQAQESQPAAPERRLKEVESALKKGQAEHEQISQKAAALAQDADATRVEMVAAARAVQEREETLSDLELQLTDLDAVQQAKLHALDLKRQQMNGVLAALERLALRPSETLIAQPTSPADTVRSAILLRDVVPRIDEAAAGLKADLDSLAATRAEIAAQRQKIAAATQRLDADHKRLATLYTHKAQMQQETEAERRDTEKHLASLASEAQDLRDLLTRLEEERRRQQAAAAAKAAAKQAALEEKARERQQALAKSFSHAQGEMPIPARGRVVIHFGQADDQGNPAKGITIETRPGAQVVAPFDGQVVFAGPFRGYGLLLIIEHSEGYHTLLAGMSRIDSSVGQRLLAGEPVGIMGETAEKPLLYVELRRNGQPINPLPWLTARKVKVSG